MFRQMEKLEPTNAVTVSDVLNPEISKRSTTKVLWWRVLEGLVCSAVYMGSAGATQAGGGPEASGLGRHQF
jgi:hypothetical protein